MEGLGNTVTLWLTIPSADLHLYLPSLSRSLQSAPVSPPPFPSRLLPKPPRVQLSLIPPLWPILYVHLGSAIFIIGLACAILVYRARPVSLAQEVGGVAYGKSRFSLSPDHNFLSERNWCSLIDYKVQHMTLTKLGVS